MSRGLKLSVNILSTGFIKLFPVFVKWIKASVRGGLTGGRGMYNIVTGSFINLKTGSTL